MPSMLTLFRPFLCALASLSAAAGYLLHPSPHHTVTGARLVLGIFLLAAGCSAVNQVQEREVDARMKRTRLRPVASGRLSPRSGLALGIAASACGLLLLAAAGRGAGAGLGLFALFWYNGVYTPLKRLTPWALLTGAVCGAIPPLIGWVSAGGHPSDFRIILLAGLIFLWQIPHFWFFALKHREDFERSGLPTIFSRLPPLQVNRLALVWVFSLASATFLLPGLGLLHHPVARLIGWSVAFGLAGGAGLKLLTGTAETPRGAHFGKLNLSLLLILSSLLVEGLF